MNVIMYFKVFIKSLVTKMDKAKLYSKYFLSLIKYTFLLIVFHDIYIKFHSTPFTMNSFIIFYIFLIINDFSRTLRKTRNTKPFLISLLITILAGTFLRYAIPNGTGTTLYVIFSLFEIFNFRKNRFKFFLFLHATIFISSTILICIHPFTFNSFTAIILNLVIYFSILSVLFSIMAIDIEKEETTKLNHKLNLANIKLQEYSLQVEDLTISTERARVSQELHDSLGHSLMALNMHIEFAKKIVNSNPDKVEKVLIKSEEIAKLSIATLRDAVNALKKDRYIESINLEINKLIQNFNMFNNIKIFYSSFKNIDKIHNKIKYSFYRTIQEFLTNSIKHGNATEIHIFITEENLLINLTICDNGIGCDTILNSTGLNGIDNRIKNLGGTVTFQSKKNLGFKLKALVPMYMEDK
ncbi:Signal transduction histidine kinase [Clostridium acidisoli DSM 12555]|uniref:histidine kinase n=2 Tax=Clostridium TaxID=1485 RepID=A0A1W1XJZ6_9CLOT|nr:Signal transduction histidine kinase [Clostridium acidisoli DSM 12555]